MSGSMDLQIALANTTGTAILKAFEDHVCTMVQGHLSGELTREQFQQMLGEALVKVEAISG